MFEFPNAIHKEHCAEFSNAIHKKRCAEFSLSEKHTFCK
ncbi:hypothetical protein LEP1GSC085_3683 [Leptospira interrogans str. L0996]|nr:hypothetical protein LEP1GSC085_3683 [Leptospira interrogans str. L0996]